MHVMFLLYACQYKILHQLCCELFAQMYEQVSSTTVSISTVLPWVQPANLSLGLQQQLCSCERQDPGSFSNSGWKGPQKVQSAAVR